MTWPSHYEADWLYLLQDIVDKHHVKIGISNNPNRRVREIRESTGYCWRIIRAIHLGPRRALYAEQHLLREYKNFRIRGTEQLQLSSEAALLRLLSDYAVLNGSKPAKPIAARITPPGLEPKPRKVGYKPHNYKPTAVDQLFGAIMLLFIFIFISIAIEYPIAWLVLISAFILWVVKFVYECSKV